MQSNHSGQYWIGGYEKLGDECVETLTSAPFIISQPIIVPQPIIVSQSYASFLSNGGDHETARVELILKDTGKAFYQNNGTNSESMRRVVVELRAHVGKEVIIRLVDQYRGGWVHLNFDNFHLSGEVKLTDNAGNSGIQFRSRAHDGEVSGYQADIGKGWWGKRYEEHGRKLLWNQSGDQHVKLGDWNKYEIIAKGHHIQTFINGQPCVDLQDPDGATRGIIAFQLHSGGKTEVRYRNMKLDLLSP